MDRDKRTLCKPSSDKPLPPSDGLGGRDPEKKGCARRAKALVARLAYSLWLWACGPGGGGVDAKGGSAIVTLVGEAGIKMAGDPSPEALLELRQRAMLRVVSGQLSVVTGHKVIDH